MRYSIILLLFCLFQFQCKTTQNPPAENGGETLTLYVAAQRVDCTGVGPQTCYQTRQSPKEDWTLFYGQIEGFDFEPGYEYQLIVEKTTIPNPPADASSFKYKLKKQVAKTRVDYGGLHDIWALESLNGKTVDVTERPRLELFPGEERIGGFAGCNQFFGKMKLDGQKVDFSGIGSTRMFCDGKMDLESQFLSALDATDQYVIKNLQLTLSQGNQQLMVLRKVD
ncbi:MAG: hypothetical protein DHS20C18_37010 [Saprospiraceae bacterium]|nr:MAG: hypothetical protein DHS20C18_37010 [Saprospiraceae bacterium]